MNERRQEKKSIFCEFSDFTEKFQKKKKMAKNYSTVCESMKRVKIAIFKNV
jgi:hypothetical protein